MSEILFRNLLNENNSHLRYTRFAYMLVDQDDCNIAISQKSSECVFDLFILGICIKTHCISVILINSRIPLSTTKKFESPLIPLSPIPVSRNPVTVSFRYKQNCLWSHLANQWSAGSNRFTVSPITATNLFPAETAFFLDIPLFSLSIICFPLLITSSIHSFTILLTHLIIFIPHLPKSIN